MSKDFIFLAEEHDTNEDKVYMSNNPSRIGAGFSWKHSVISFSYGYGFDFLRDKKLGKTETKLDFQYHYYNRKFVFDIFLQKYKGFYFEKDKGNSETSVVCPDMKIRQYAVFGQYVFNGNEFSYKAAFDQSEKQLKSVGTFLLGGGINSTKIGADSSFLYKNQNVLENFQFGVSAGYAYSWVINKRWLLGGSITTGINFGSKSFNTFGKQKLEVYPTAFPRLSASYNKEDWSLGFSFISNVVFPSFSDDSHIALYSGNFNLTYTKRLSTVPFFSKKK